MPQFHFVDDYVAHVRELLKNHPLEEAMSLAVGGSFTEIGNFERDILVWGGLKNGQRVLDFGCGSGRLATSLSAQFKLDYVGFDVVQELLDYAASVCPASYRFKLNQSLSFPLAANSLDMIGSFSVFTHLLHAETYLYLQDMHRCLKPGAVMIASFLEFALPIHWHIFAVTVEQQRSGAAAPLNQYIEKNQWLVWSQKLGFSKCEFVDGDAPLWPSGLPFGQSVVKLTK